MENKNRLQEIADILSELKNDAIIGARSDYSGRGMYGETCFAVKVDRYEYKSAMELLRPTGAASDNLGTDMIVYWPSITYAEICEFLPYDLLVD